MQKKSRIPTELFPSHNQNRSFETLKSQKKLEQGEFGIERVTVSDGTSRTLIILFISIITNLDLLNFSPSAKILLLCQVRF